MGFSRRFLSLIVENRIAGARSLRCINLTGLKLFYKTPNGALRRKKNMAMDYISLPKPSIHMRGPDSDLHLFPAVERRVFCLDQEGRGLLLEADTSRMVMLPGLHKPKLEPISLYIPCADEPCDDLGGTFFIMDRIAKPEVEAGCQFEALVYRKTLLSCRLSWECDLLPPPPPYNRDTGHGCLEIDSYAVVSGGSQICISVKGVGTYCLDTASYEWREVGKWMLPFQGKVEYVPELRLWFGFSAKDQHLAAADLSTMDSHESQPQLLDSWKEVDVPHGWQQIQDPQLVNLGSGRFCIARFLRTVTPNCARGDVLSSEHNVTVLTGVEVARSVGFISKVNLDMVKHKSRCHESSCGEDTITAVF